MLFETNKNKFFQNYAKTTGVVMTYLISEIDDFKGTVYLDNQNRCFISINYGAGQVITVFQTYNLDLYNELINMFPNVTSIHFTHNGYISNEFVTNYLGYHYKFQGILNSEIIMNPLPFVIRTINENDVELAKQYDNLYLNNLRPNHGARMTNQINRKSLKSGDMKIYFAIIDNIPIGFILIYHYKEYFAWDIAQITIEKEYQQKGYGAAFLTEVTKDNLKQKYSLYYSGVSAGNIASRKTAEKAGYLIVSSKMCVNVE